MSPAFAEGSVAGGRGPVGLEDKLLAQERRLVTLTEGKEVTVSGGRCCSEIAGRTVEKDSFPRFLAEKGLTGAEKSAIRLLRGGS